MQGPSVLLLLQFLQKVRGPWTCLRARRLHFVSYCKNRCDEWKSKHIRAPCARCLCTRHAWPVNQIHPLFVHPDLAPQHLASDPIRFETWLCPCAYARSLFSSNCRAGWCSASSRCCLESAGGGSLLSGPLPRILRPQSRFCTLFISNQVGYLLPSEACFLFASLDSSPAEDECNCEILPFWTLRQWHLLTSTREWKSLQFSFLPLQLQQMVLLLALLSLLLVSARTLPLTEFLNASFGGAAARFFKTADVMSLNLPSHPRRKQGFTRFYLLNYPLNNSIYKKQNKKKQPRNFQVQWTISFVFVPLWWWII